MSEQELPEAPEAPVVPTLGILCEAWRDVQQTRMSMNQRNLDLIAEQLLVSERWLSERIKKELRAHPIWPWLGQFKGLGGVHVARLIDLIGNPHRFPGQACSEGHSFVPLYLDGGQCPIVAGPDAVRCEGLIWTRSGTGTRSLWHYLGLHAVDGKSPSRRRGQQADWNPKGRTMVLMPDGIADAIVKQRTAGYRDIYDQQKERLQRERGIRVVEEGAEADPVSEEVPGLRPIQIHDLARKIAAKAFVGDLLRELKKVVPLEDGSVSPDEPIRRVA